MRHQMKMMSSHYQGTTGKLFFKVLLLHFIYCTSLLRPTESLDLEGVEVASVDKSIPSTNIGYKLLKMMGWKENTGLGKDGSGIVEPIRSQSNVALLGLGKQSEHDEVAEQAAAQRRTLAIEIEETEEMKAAREVTADRY